MKPNGNNQLTIAEYERYREHFARVDARWGKTKGMSKTPGVAECLARSSDWEDRYRERRERYREALWPSRV